jgi:syntaxin-binding protein 5
VRDVPAVLPPAHPFLVTQTEIRIFKPATAKGASRAFDDVFCDAAAVTEFELHGFAIVGVFGDQTTRAYTLPGLKELNKCALAMLDRTRSTSAIVSPTGDVIGWAGPSELVVVPVWGTGRGLENTKDKMINPELAVPPRPTISNLQWISGTQYVSPTDLDLLIGGADRPPSKRMMAAAAEEARAARSGGPPGARAGTADEGWGEYLHRQLNERTEKLNIMGDRMDSLEEQSANWAEDVSKFVSKQKRNLLFGAVKSKFA